MNKIKTIFAALMLAATFIFASAFTAEAQQWETRAVYGGLHLPASCEERVIKINLIAQDWSTDWRLPEFSEEAGGWIYEFAEWQELEGSTLGFYTLAVADITATPDTVILTDVVYIAPNSKLQHDLTVTQNCSG